MRRTYQDAKKLAYNASYFSRMLDEFGGIATAKKLISAPMVSDGFNKLWSLQRLDLTVEAIALRPEFRPLFSREELAVCRDRLKALGYSA